MYNFQKEIVLRKHSQRRYLLQFLFVVVFILLGVQIVVSNVISSSGDELQLLEQRYALLRSQNEELKQNIAIVSSLTNVQNQAKNLGFTKNQVVIYLQNTVNVAMGR